MENLNARLDDILKKFSSTNVIGNFTTVKAQPAKITKDVVHYDFSAEPVTFIYPLTDVHYGHVCSNTAAFKKAVNFINTTPNCKTVLLGDMSETATKTSVGNAMFEEEVHIPEQAKALLDILQPLADNHKILGIVPGNHELRMERLIGINALNVLANYLKVPYFGYQGFMDIAVGNKGTHYQVMVHHGVGSGSTNGGKINAIEKLNKVAMADLYLAGHTHIRSYSEDNVYEIKDGRMMPRHRVYVTCGSFLEYWNSYGEMQALSPSVPGGVLIELCANYQQINVIL